MRERKASERIHDFVQMENEADRCMECGCKSVFECDLKRYAGEYGVDLARLAGETRRHKADMSHPVITLDSNKCVLCGRCVRTCSEITGLGILGFSGRGFRSVVRPTLGKSLGESDCVSCGSCVESCPTGALEARLPYGKQGPWKTEKKSSVCSFCSVGCELDLNVAADGLLWATTAEAMSLDRGGLCGKGRFGTGLKPAIYVEVKSIDTGLDGHEGQLARYFNATSSVSLAILTNGLEWRLYTDTASQNIMDSKPFCICKLDAAEQGLDVLARFCKSDFSGDAICDYATELKYTTLIANFLRRNLDPREGDPEENLIRWILAELKDAGGHTGIVNANVVNRFRPIVKAALTRTVREIVRRSISAMDEEVAPAVTQPQPQPSPVSDDTVNTPETSNTQRAIVTTEDEMALYVAI